MRNVSNIDGGILGLAFEYGALQPLFPWLVMFGEPL